MTLAASAGADLYRWIESDQMLQTLCGEWASHGALALDTEFVRTNTFYPNVGLFQLATAQDLFLIDPLAIGQWAEFSGLLADPARTVVLHSCSEDLNLLQHFLKVLPGRLFDTQRAAAFLGHGYSISYQALVAAELDLPLDKGETRSDWLKRPLTPEQKHYAALDVAHLLPLRERLESRLKARGMLEWFEDDCREILLAVKDDSDEQQWARYYRQIPGAWRLNRVQLAALQRLCYWRERKAREWNRPRSWILKDSDLLSLAGAVRQQPVSRRMLQDASDLTERFFERHGEAILSCINTDKAFSDVPDPGRFSKPLDGVWRRKLKNCQRLVTRKAEEIDVAPELLARKRQLLELIDGFCLNHDDPWPGDLDNWRRPLLEPGLMEILEAGDDSRGDSSDDDDD